MNRRALAIAIGIASLGATGLAVGADAYPSKAVRIVVPYNTGGSADVLARHIATGLQQAWGQAVVVENRAGASGNIGSSEVVRAPADGYTLLLQNSTMVGNLAVMGKLPYDVQKDLTPIMYLGETPLALVAYPGANISNLKELVAAAKAKPGGLSYGSCGIGTPHHFVMELVKDMTGIEATHAAYKGCSPALQDVLGGQIPVAVVTANLVVPHAASGKLKVIAVSTAKRYPQLPETPSLEEQGLKPFDIANWNGLMGPAKLPPEVVAKVAAGATKVLSDPAVAASLQKLGVEPNARPAAALSAVIRTDTASYAKLVKDANIKPE